MLEINNYTVDIPIRKFLITYGVSMKDFKYYTTEELKTHVGKEVLYISIGDFVRKSVLCQSGNKVYLEPSCCSQFADTARLFFY